MIRFSKDLFSLVWIFSALCFISGCGKSSVPGDSPSPEPDPEIPAVVTYKTGDYYEHGFKKGIVISVDESGEHGLIVSLKETVAAWSYKNEEAMSSLPGSGSYNTACVYTMKDWEQNYPGFLWCSQMNVGKLKEWFIPSLHELTYLYKAYTGREPNDPDQGTGSSLNAGNLSSDRPADGASEEQFKTWFNNCLTSNNGTALSDAVYWSSNEAGPSIAYAFNMGSGLTVTVPSDLDKSIEYRFRAMASF